MILMGENPSVCISHKPKCTSQITFKLFITVCKRNTNCISWCICSLYFSSKMYSFMYKMFADPLLGWKKRTPKRKWMVLYNFVKFLSNILQIRLLDNCNNGPIAYIPIATGLNYYGLLGYTISYYIHTKQFSQCLPAFCIFGALNSVCDFLLHFFEYNCDFVVISFCCAHAQAYTIYWT